MSDIESALHERMLYEVSYRCTKWAYVVAKNEKEAREIAQDEIEWWDIDEAEGGDIQDIFETDRLIDRNDRIPYGDPEGRTCEWWLNLSLDMREEMAAQAKAKAEFDAHPTLDLATA